MEMKEIKEAAKDFLRSHPSYEVGVSRLQRELKIGYTQAANILAQLVEEGFISSPKMTDKFKFGDMVRDKHTRLGICVVINASEYFVYIMNENGHYNTIANPEHLEHIPHPDTVRLDWLAEQGAAVLPNTDDMFCTMPVAMAGSPILGLGQTYREAIDAAMKVESHDE